MVVLIAQCDQEVVADLVQGPLRVGEQSEQGVDAGVYGV